MNSFISKLFQIFNYILVIFPIGMSVFLAVVYLLGGWGSIIEGHSPDFYFLPEISFSLKGVLLVVLWILLGLGIIAVIHFVCERLKDEKKKDIAAVLMVFFAAFLFRMVLLYIFREDLVPFSDFNAAWEIARGNWEGGNINYYSLFPAYLNFSVLERLIIKIVGEKYICVLYIDAIFSALTSALLYLMSIQIFDKKRFIAICTSVLYAVYPTNILYLTVGTSEFITIFFNTLGLFFLVLIVKSNEKKKQLLFALLGGVMLGIGGSFKTYSIVMIIAFFLINFSGIFTAEHRELFKKIAASITILVLILVGYVGSSSMILNITSNYFGMELSTKTAIPQYLLVGLNTESEGQIHVGTLSRLYNKEYLNNGMDFEAAKTFAFDLLKNDWSNNFNEIAPNLAKKMIWAWQDDYIPVGYFLGRVGINLDSRTELVIYNFMNEYGGLFFEIAYLLIMILALIGGIYFAKKRELVFLYEFLALSVFGYFCMIFIAEAQSRYKCLVMPYIIVMSGFGLNVIIDYIKGKKKLV